MSRSRKKRETFNPLSLSFLDVMSCGFGAVILVFLIIDHSSTVNAREGDPELLAEVNLLEEEILEGSLGLVQIKNILSDVNFEVVTAEGLADRIREEIQNFLQELAAMEDNSLATKESVERLRADIQALEEELLRLQASALEQVGQDAREFLGDGDRQYLTGMFLGGNRILILLDKSASMLDSTLINIIRTRNMTSDDAKRNAPKWQRTVRSIDWLTSQLPVSSEYQIYAFNDEVSAVLEGTMGQWLEVADQDQLIAVMDGINEIVPANGTNMEKAFQSIAQLSPPPDNIFLITDGLPTLTNRKTSDRLITPEKRYDIFQDALEYLPSRVPVNVILLPLEGDPEAAVAFWELAYATHGSFLSPSKDWP